MQEVTFVRAMADFADGVNSSSYQPYASVVAAAVMKMIIMNIKNEN